MSSYIVLARKWRSAQFEDVVGQGHIVRTLMNAVRTGRVHQAYLFTGSRGIGKTSIARIFAKVLRCEHTKTDEKSEMKWLSSCDECSSCKEIAGSSSVDVIEIDGASNNGVDAVREIRENAKYMPQTGDRKIYIIDEVHMLTTAAFNALLKTLEEPPAHVVFIFATTEPHKIPATILSRCQRFDFRRYTSAQIQPHLAKIAKSEGIQADPAALAMISRAAEGSMRDALSLLDQVIAFSGTKVTVESARDSIGLIEGQTVLGIVGGIFKRKPAEALALVDQAYQRGHDLRVLTRSLIEFLHGAVMAKVGASMSALEISEEEQKELAQIAQLRELEEIELIFQVLHQGLDWIARSPQPKVVLDILLVKCATAEALIVLRADNSGGGTNKPGLRAESTAPVKAPSSSSSTSAQAISQASPVAQAAPTPIAVTAPSHVMMDAHPELSPAKAIAASLKARADAPPAPRPVAAAAPAPSVPSAANAAVMGPKSWEGFIEFVRLKRPLLASILEHGSCTSFATDEQTVATVTIGFGPDGAYFKEQLSSGVTQNQLQATGLEYFGRRSQFRIEMIAEAPAGESMAARKKRESELREKLAREAAQTHPVILEARSLFGAELGPIEVLSQPENHA